MFKNLLIAASLSTGFAASAQAQPMDVAKNAGCGCCGGWIEQMQAAGFEVAARNISNEALYELKLSLGIGEEMMSCHTASVEGYSIEGHVPLVDIRRLLAERPDAVGLAVPGMPVGSPGMEYGDMKDAYDVFLIGRDGSTEVFASYAGN